MWEKERGPSHQRHQKNATVGPAWEKHPSTASHITACLLQYKIVTYLEVLPHYALLLQPFRLLTFRFREDSQVPDEVLQLLFNVFVAY